MKNLTETNEQTRNQEDTILFFTTSLFLIIFICACILAFSFGCNFLVRRKKEVVSTANNTNSTRIGVNNNRNIFL